ncbi:MAG: SIS domain-containing protein [Bdellovibrionota bacterium]
MVNRVEQIFKETFSPKEFAEQYVHYLKEIMNNLDFDRIGQFIDLILLARNTGKRIYFLGNGGSASTASHFANDLSAGTRSWKKPFKAISLTDNNAILTAIGNDAGYEEIFVQQLKTHLEIKDVVVAISASGNSTNVIKAIDYANSIGAVTVGLTGFDGGKLREVCHLSLHVPSNMGEYGPVEDVHMIFDHLLYGYLLGIIKNENFGNHLL